MTTKWRDATSKAAWTLVIAVLALAVLRTVGSAPAKRTARPVHLPMAWGGPTYHAVVRTGGEQDWEEFDYPTTWYTDTLVIVQNWDPEDDTWPPTSPLARLEEHGGRGLCDEVDCNTFFPEGTVTETMEVDGRLATKYSYQYEPPVSGAVLIDVEPPPGQLPFYFELRVNFAHDQDEYESLMGVMEAIVSSYRFIPYYLDTSSWERTDGDSQLPSLEHYNIYHPPGWTVTETATEVVAASPPGSEAMAVAFEPGHSDSEWEAATPMLGTKSERLVSRQTAGGVQTTVYMTSNRMKVTTTVPERPYGSAEYWALEQTVMEIFEGSGFRPALPSYP